MFQTTMARIERLSTVEAAKLKGCTRQGIFQAIQRGKLDAEKVGRTNLVIANKKFEEWTPNPKIQAARRKKPAKRAKRANRK